MIKVATTRLMATRLAGEDRRPQGPIEDRGRPSPRRRPQQWALLEPLPPPGNTGGRGGRPEKHDRRRVLDAIFYLVRGGIAWAALPTAAVIDPAPVRGAATVPTASRGYDAGRLVTRAQTVLTFTATIARRTDDLTGFRVLPRRWVVERTLARISRHRRCVRDQETLPEHAEAMVYIAMIMTMSRRLAR